MYKENSSILKATINSFLSIDHKKRLFLIDNSPSTELEYLGDQKEVEYIHTGKNLGFGNGHNFILDQINSDFHLVLNPDISFEAEVISVLINQLHKEKNTAFITPKIIYPNGDLQIVCRKHPTFFKLIKRKFRNKNEYPDQDFSKFFYPEFIHGCFMLFKTNILKELNGFDDRFFLYMEDADICKRIEKKGMNILYLPVVQVTHHFRKGSSKNLKLFLVHTSSAIKYFLKWGF